MTQATTIQRGETFYGNFRLDNTVGRLLIPVTGADGVIVAAYREFGSAWSTVVLSVKRISGTGSTARDFSTPKTIAAGGGQVSLSPSELAGVDWIEVAYSSGSAEASGTTATIGVATNVMLEGHVSVPPPTASSAPGTTNSTTVDVTTSGDSFASTVVTGQTWVASGSEIVATLMDHPSGTSAEEAIAEGVTVGVGAIVAGTGFTVYLKSPNGGIGPYRVAIVGV
jgi:hypothetical protein